MEDGGHGALEQPNECTRNAVGDVEQARKRYLGTGDAPERHENRTLPSAVCRFAEHDDLRFADRCWA